MKVKLNFAMVMKSGGTIERPDRMRQSDRRINRQRSTGSDPRILVKETKGEEPKGVGRPKRGREREREREGGGGKKSERGPFPSTDATGTRKGSPSPSLSLSLSLRPLQD